MPDLCLDRNPANHGMTCGLPARHPGDHKFGNWPGAGTWAAPCRVTTGPERIACTLPSGHSDRHKGGGWVWWHGNGEECPPGCALCARLAPPPGDAA